MTGGVNMRAAIAGILDAFQLVAQSETQRVRAERIEDLRNAHADIEASIGELNKAKAAISLQIAFINERAA